jgi:predicted PurR-regulated permease PerM
MTTTVRYNWLVATALVLWLLYMLAPILTPFIAAGLLAYIGDPLADRLQKWKFPRTLAVITVFILTFLTVGLMALLVLPLIRTQVGSLLAALPGIIAGIEDVFLPRLSGLLGMPSGEEVGFAAFIERYSDMASSWASALLMSVSRSGSVVVAAVISLFLIPILTFYLLRDWDWIVARIGSLVPSGQHETVFALARETDKVLGAFLRGQILVMMALSVMYIMGLSLVGLEYAFAIGIVAGLVSFVPYLGFVFGIALASLTVIVQPEPLWPLVGVVATFTIAQMIEGSVLTPKLVGDRIGLHPVIVIFAIAAGGQLFGFFGILLALPAAAVLSVLVRFAYGRYLAEHPQAEAELQSDD